jgi:hypothetical protein
MFILAGFSQLLGMLVFRALQVLKWFNFPVFSYVDAKLVCRFTKIKLVIFDDFRIQIHCLLVLPSLLINRSFLKGLLSK